MSRDTSFYYSFLVLPPRKRSAIIAVWDFCRAVDDAVDEIVPEEEWAGGLTPAARATTAAQLAAWRSELAEVFVGTPRTAQGIALKTYAAAFHLPRAHFEELIDGVEMDLDRVRYDTFVELHEYCRRVASAVGLICLEIFGYQNPRAKVYAGHLGVALQLTNIIRDIRADRARGRIYLPAEDLERFGVTAADLDAGRVTPAMAALLRFECERAHEYYRRAAEQLPPEDARSLLAAEIMGAIYSEILQRIERSGYEVFGDRIRVPRARRAVIALRMWLTALLGFPNARLKVEKETRPGH
jgi:phytoene synthase